MGLLSRSRVFAVLEPHVLPPFSIVTSKTSNIRANFENLAKEKEQEDRRKAEAERAQRMAKERQEQEEARRKLEVSGKEWAAARSPSRTCARGLAALGPGRGLFFPGQVFLGRHV